MHRIILYIGPGICQILFIPYYVFIIPPLPQMAIKREIPSVSYAADLGIGCLGFEPLDHLRKIRLDGSRRVEKDKMNMVRHHNIICNVRSWKFSFHLLKPNNDHLFRCMRAHT